EFINKPVNRRFMGFYISTRIAPELRCTTLKTGLTKSHDNLRLLSLAREFNFVREIGRIAGNGLYMLRSRFRRASVSGRT
ncbi:MAG: hypothetical protein AAGU27_29110, partial [Dehalobacterium sp.]